MSCTYELLICPYPLPTFSKHTSVVYTCFIQHIDKLWFCDSRHLCYPLSFGRGWRWTRLFSFCSLTSNLVFLLIVTVTVNHSDLRVSPLTPSKSYWLRLTDWRYVCRLFSWSIRASLIGRKLCSSQFDIFLEVLNSGIFVFVWWDFQQNVADNI